MMRSPLWAARSNISPVSVSSLMAGARSPSFSSLGSIALPQLSLEEIVHGAGIGLAPGRLHDLPDQEPDHRGLTVAVLLRLLGIRRQHLIDDLVEGARVADLPQAFTIHNDGRRLSGLKHFGENVFGQ